MKQISSLILTLIIALSPAQLAFANTNSPPVAETDYVATNSDQPLTFNVLTNDHDPDGDYIYLTGWSTNGSFSGSLSYNGNGSLTYTPVYEFHGQTFFDYYISDTANNSASGRVFIDVQRAYNQAPVVVNDSATLLENESASVSALLNDSDPDGDDLRVCVMSYGEINGTATLAYNVMTYTPNPGFTGQAVITYTACDTKNYRDVGGQTNGTVTFTVTKQLVVNDDYFTGNEDNSVNGNVLTNDTGEGTLLASLDSDANNGTVSLNSDGSFTYTATNNYNGNDWFTYTVLAENGQSSTGTAYITVNPVNDAPVASNDAFTTDEDTVLSSDVTANDSDVDGDILTTSVVQTTTNGVLSLNTDGTFTYTPDANYFGSDSFTYEVQDPSGAASTATVSITVNSVNDAPVAEDDSFTTNEDTQVSGNVLANDSDIDDQNLTASLVSTTTNGSLTLNSDGSFTYIPSTNFNGQDTFTYNATDASGAISQATVTLTVNPVNDAPVASNDAFTTDEDTVLSSDVTANDSDVDGDILTTSVVQTTTNGVLSLNTDGTFTYTPDANYFGSDSFTYEVQDPSGAASTATVSITVNSVNDAPVASYSHSEQGKTRRITFDASASYDSDGTIVSYHWQYGDGTTFTTTSSVHTYRYSSAGTFTAILTVTDSQGGQKSYSSTVNPG